MKIGDGSTRWINLPYQNGLGVTGDLLNLTDVKITNLENGDVIKYDQTSGKWINLSLAEAGIATVAQVYAAVPPGVISQFAGSTAPSGYLLCTGQELAISSYENLYAVLGTTYGTLTNGSGGAGTTHFRLPNLQNRVPVGKGSEAEFDALGEVGGTKAVELDATQIPAHSHPNSLGGTTSFASTGHTHSHVAQGGLNSGAYIAINAGDGNLDAVGSYSFNTIVNGTAWFGGNATGGVTYERHMVTSAGPSATGTVTLNNANNVGGGQAHTNLQPYIVLNYIIKT